MKKKQQKYFMSPSLFLPYSFDKWVKQWCFFVLYWYSHRQGNAVDANNVQFVVSVLLIFIPIIRFWDVSRYVSLDPSLIAYFLCTVLADDGGNLFSCLIRQSSLRKNFSSFTQQLKLRLLRRGRKIRLASPCHISVSVRCSKLKTASK